jgi:hypothetical protein
MTEEEWLEASDPRAFLMHDPSEERRKPRLFCVACCRRIWNLCFDARTRSAVEVSERFADALATHDELFSSHEAAYFAMSNQEGNVYSLDAGWHCSRLPVNERRCAEACARAAGLGTATPYDEDRERKEFFTQSHLLRDIFGNPFRPVAFDAAWRTSTAVALAQGMYESRNFDAMPILADALQDGGCDSDDILTHCRDPQQVHVRGCWVVDLVLGKV